MEKTKVMELESIRGVAALVVAVGHFFYGFFPFTHSDAMGTPAFALFNGGFAVVLFFVLSGYVLAISPLQTGSFGKIIVGALKRWPRLALPVVIVSAISGFLSLNSLYFNKAAGDLTGSIWIASFDYHFGEKPSMQDALYEGAYFTFFSLTGSNSYNAVLWTMHYEFAGSFLVFALTAVILLFRKSVFFTLLLLAIATAWTVWYDVRYASFIAGLALAYARTQFVFKPKQIPLVMVAFCAITVMYIAGFDHPYRDYAYLETFWPFDDLHLFTLLHTFAAAIVISLAVFTTNLKPVLSNAALVELGRLSFPLYLVHVPIYCSFSALLAVWLIPTLGVTTGSVVVLVLTVPMLYFCAWPLSYLDEKWTRALGYMTKGPVIYAS